MATRDPAADYRRAARAIPFAIREWLRQNLHTALPGEIIAYDARTKRARVQPSLRAIVAQPDGSQQSVNRAPLWDVPVLWPGGAGFIFTSGLARGDQVWLSFSERGLDLWKQDWALADPPPFTMFEMRDAVAHPIGAQTITAVEGTTDGVLAEVTPQASGPRTRLEGATLQSVDGSVFVRVADDEIKLQIGSIALSITSAGFAFTGGAVTHNGVNIGHDHVHDGVSPGGSTTGGPQ